MSTFELFLQLPLFEGVEMDELFSLIPKINLDFDRFQPGDVVLDHQMESQGIVYLLKGTVVVSAHSEKMEKTGPALLSFSRSFGDKKQYWAEVAAQDGCTILKIGNESLLFLLQKSPVILSNYIGLLSNTIHALNAGKTILIV